MAHAKTVQGEKDCKPCLHGYGEPGGFKKPTDDPSAYPTTDKSKMHGDGITGGAVNSKSERADTVD